MVISHDGKYLFTAGGTDLTVNMWQFDISVFNENLAKAGTGSLCF